MGNFTYLNGHHYIYRAKKKSVSVINTQTLLSFRPKRKEREIHVKAAPATSVPLRRLHACDRLDRHLLATTSATSATSAFHILHSDIGYEGTSFDRYYLHLHDTIYRQIGKYNKYTHASLRQAVLVLTHQLHLYPVSKNRRKK